MRAVFSIAALLIVVFVVMKLAANQLHALTPAAAPGASQPARNAAQAAADQISDAIAKGAAARASEADAQ
ncbi:MAG: hypothetical protein KGL43_06090 [Burkholderiales bacterium]|nr:hypothetical protein [Burkholderiales bacterium]MDE2397482.1 hypothetical protein [Burkholderiales bacterium]MDE2453144.1 hypothetical protein [Burkholderiales bacterium]